jgi:hypothetical protein
MSNAAEMTDEELVDNIIFEVLRSNNRPDLADELSHRLSQRLRPEDITLLNSIYGWLHTIEPQIDLIGLCDPWRETWEERLLSGVVKGTE